MTRHLPPTRLRQVSPPPKSSTANDPIKETLTFIRSHSSMRFVALPFFLGTIAVLTRAFYEPGGVPRPVLAATALGLTLVATSVEVVLSRNLIAWWTALGQVAAKEPAWAIVLAHRHAAALTWVRWALFLPYVCALGFWLHKVLRVFVGPVTPLADGPQRWLFGVVALFACSVLCFCVDRVWKTAQQAPPLS